jgi:hypothetical protein
MKIFKHKQVELLDEVICDVCGESCKDQNIGNEFASLCADWGYASKQDGAKYDINLCENCFEKTLQFLKSARQIKPNGHDPLSPIWQ